MKSIKNDYCIRMFVGSDEYRPWLSKVHAQNGNLYATNAISLAKVSKDLCMKDYEPVDKFPDVEKLFQNHVPVETKRFPVESLFHELMIAECCFKPKMVDCGECDGDGEVTCDHCGSEVDCKTCGGTGRVKTKEMVLSGYGNCLFFGRKYNFHQLDLIIKLAVYTGAEEIEASNSDGAGGTVFRVGDFTVLAMTIITK